MTKGKYTARDVEKYQTRIRRDHQNELISTYQEAFAKGFEAGATSAKNAILEALGVAPPAQKGETL